MDMRPLKEAIETAEDVRNSNGYVGSVFRQYLPRLKVLSIASAVLDWDRIVDVTTLPMHVIDDLFEQHTDKEYENLSETEKEEILRRHLTGLTAREVFDQYLKYNGIINYNDTFIGVINALHKV